MRKLVISLATVLSALAGLAAFTAEPMAKQPVAAATATAQPAARHTVTRTERCNSLGQQFSRAISQHAEAKRAAEARALQKKAVKFCASKRQAQGIRAYAKALKLLGVQPIDP